jgi:hypothetical protein
MTASPWDVSAPVLFNAWKHHAGFLRHRIAGAAPLDRLAAELVVVGTELMDLYTGELSAATIAEKVVGDLRTRDRFALPGYREWITAAGGYRVVELSDTSRWVLRLGDEAGRYVHVHPGRWSPRTLRVRANVLKTAVLAVAFAAESGGDPRDVALLNAVRQQFPGLSPLGRVARGEQGIGAVIDVLRSD